MHAIELCAGVDDRDPRNLKIMPRVPEPLKGVKGNNFFTLAPKGQALVVARVTYRYEKNSEFRLRSDRPLPTLFVRLGPFAGDAEACKALGNAAVPDGSAKRIESSGHFRGREAWWLWVEGLTNVRELKLSF